MEFFEKNKKIILIVGILAIVLIGYLIFFSGDSSSPSVVAYDPSAGGLVSDVSASIGSDVGGRELLSILSRLKSISLDSSIFSDEAFKSLDDKSRPIDAQPFGKTLGRRNPFSDFGSKSIQSTTTSAF
ncbi:MAG: hypothetical protein EXS59_00035 [Candidatus Taylorbacteria bacterium]|nr:hypothetical protein [Candidatus Taylorbacteria bacterium]